MGIMKMPPQKTRMVSVLVQSKPQTSNQGIQVDHSTEVDRGIEATDSYKPQRGFDVELKEQTKAMPVKRTGMHVPSREEILKKYEEIAEGMETQFNEYMIQQMRKSIPKDEPDSSANEYYNSLLDSERAKIMADNKGGIGLKKMILDQILPAHLKQQPHSTMINAYAKQAGLADQRLTANKENGHE